MLSLRLKLLIPLTILLLNQKIGDSVNNQYLVLDASEPYYYVVKEFSLTDVYSLCELNETSIISTKAEKARFDSSINAWKIEKFEAMPIQEIGPVNEYK